MSKKVTIIVCILLALALAVAGVSAQDQGETRDLAGTLTIAANGALPVPGAPETITQQAWANTIARYQELHPNVEIVLEDLPAGLNGEEWCAANKAAQSMPDLSFVEECNEFQPTAEQIELGTSIAVDNQPFATEINPYTGDEWQNDWLNDFWRTARCQELGALGTWTCFSPFMDGGGLYTNMAILRELGYETIPNSYTELFELMDRANEAGYIAYDTNAGRINILPAIFSMNLAMNEFEAAGGDINDMAGTGSLTQAEPARTTAFCEGILTISDSPAFLEAFRLTREFVEHTMPGGAAAFFDPSRDQSGQMWLSGQALFREQNTGFYRNIRQAVTDEVFAVDDWQILPLPQLRPEDLENPDLEIFFEGYPYFVTTPQGDIFTPIPASRASGENEMIDLMARDFLQFLSSPEGQELFVQPLGFIPANTKVEPLDPRMLGFLETRNEIFDGLGWFPLASTFEFFGADPESNMQAYLSGNLELEEAAARADANVVRTLTQNLEDNLEVYGLTELPEACQ